MPRPNISEKRRKEIAMAFYRCARNKGIAATTTRDIAHEAGVKQGLLYHYFRDRDDMVEQMVVIIAENHINNFTGKVDTDGTPDELLDRALDFLLGEEMISDTGSLFYDVWSEAKRNPRVAHALEKVYHNFRRTVGEFLSDSGIAGPLSYAEINVLSTLIIAMYEGVFLQWDFDRDNIDFEQIKKTMKGLIAGYATPAAAAKK